MRILKKSWPALIILFVCLILFRQFFLKGLLPVPADITVGLYYPWLDYKWGTLAGVPVKNPLISDIPSLLYPWRMGVIDQFKSGRWPLWNPYYFMGMPLLANFQSAAFSYVNLFFLVFNRSLAWSLGVMASPFLTMIFLYWFLRRKKLSQIPALFGAVIFGLSGFQIAWLEYNVHGHTALMLPVLLVLVDYYLESNRRLALWLIPLVVAMQIFTGYIPIVIYSWLFLALYVFYFYFILPYRKKHSFEEVNLKKIILLGVFFVWGVSLSAIQLLPGLELTNLSIRQVDPLVEASNASFLPLINVLTAFAPDIFGNPATGNYFGTAFYDNFYFFNGTITVWLVLLSLGLFKKNHLVRFGWLILLLSLLMATKNPVGELINRWLMLNGGVAARSLYLTDFSIAILAGFGITRLTGNINLSKSKIIIWLLPVIGLGIASWRYGISLSDPVNRMVAIRNLVIPGGTLVTGVLVILIPRLAKSIKIFILLVLTTGQLLYSAGKYLPFSVRQYLFPTTPVIDFLVDQQNQQKVPFRVELGKVIPQNMLMPYGIETTSGYDALLPLKNARFLSLLETGQVNLKLSRVWLLDNYDSPLFPLTNTKYILAKKTNRWGIFSPDGQTPPRFEDPRYRKAFEDKTVVVYEDLKYLPRILEPNIQSEPDMDIIWHSDEPGNLNFDISLDKNRPIILSMMNYPGWKATVNNQPVKIAATKENLITFDLFQGENQVRLEYYPNSFRIGLLISSASFLSWFIMLLLYQVRLRA